MVKDELYHYGVLGMKWGVRRYQNPDGSLTKLGEQRVFKSRRSLKKALKKSWKADQKAKGYSANIYTGISSTGKHYDKVEKQFHESRRPLREQRSKIYEKIDYEFDKNPDIDYEDYERKYLSDKSYVSNRTAISKEYAKKFNQAKLKDIGVKNISEGEKYLKEYGLAYYVDDKGHLRYGKYTYLN